MSIIIGYIGFWVITRSVGLYYVRQVEDSTARYKHAETWVMCLAPVMSELIIIGGMSVVLLEEALIVAIRATDRVQAALAAAASGG